MSQIINGLQIDVPAEELKAILASRIGYYDLKASKYTKALEKDVKLQAAQDEVDAELAEEAEAIGKYANSSMGSTNRADQLKAKITQAKNQANYFKFMSEHVVTGATYRLDNTALQLVGIMDRGW